MSRSLMFLRRLAVCLYALCCLVAKPFAQTPVPAKPTRFSVVTQGKGPDVIMIPGLGSGRDDFDAEAALLTPNYRLHLVQIAGFAGEPSGPNATGPMLPGIVDQLHQYVADNHVEHPAVIGHSLGGLLALMWAIKYPADTGRLLVIDTLPYYGLIFSPDATVALVAPQAKVMGDTVLAMPAEQYAVLLPMSAGRMVKSPDGLKIVVADTLKSDRAVVVGATEEDLATDLRGQLGAIKVPVTVLYAYTAALGAEAEVLAMYNGSYAGLTQAKLVKVDDSLHFIMLDQPAAFHRAVVAFLQ